MKKILKALLVLIGMIAMLFIVAVIVNLSVFDEELLPEVQAIKDIEAKPYQADNAYPALVAMSYYPEERYQSAIQKIRNRLNQNISRDGYDFLNKADEEQLKADKIDSQRLSDYSRCHTRKERNCVEKYVNQLKKQPINQTTQIWLDRYRQLIEYKHYSESTQLQFDSPIPAFGPVLQAQRVLLLEQWMDNHNGFVPLISKDLAFWRMVLKNNNLLITKMVALAAIHNDIQILAYSIKSGELNRELLESLQNQIQILSNKERSMKTIFQFEMKIGTGILDNYQELIGNPFSQLFLQPHATHNLQYETTIVPLNNLNELDSQAFAKSYRSDNWSNKPKSAVSLYNPSGKYFVNIGTVAYQEYIARTHDLNAMLVLLKLRIELALNNDQNIASVVNNSKHNNPYSNQPFNYDSETQSIGFECLDKTSVCEILL